MEIVPKIAVSEKNEQSSLTLMWAAYQRSQFSGVESSLKISTGLPSPYWLPNYRSSTVLESEGAGVVVGLLNARYYDGGRGQFLSQDPVSLDISDVAKLRTRNLIQQTLLLDPQLSGSYSYARNNPVTHTDRTGEIIPAAVAYGLIWGWAMLNYDFLQYNIAEYEAETARLNPEIYSQQQIRDAQQAVSDQGAGALIGFGIGELLGSPIGPAVDILGVIDDARQEWYERNPEAKERPNEIRNALSDDYSSLEGYTGTYRSPMSPQKMNNFVRQVNSTIWGDAPSTPQRSPNPTGVTPSGDPIYCWGACDK